MKKICLFGFIFLISIQGFAADKTYGQKVGTTDTLVNLNYRDRDTLGTSWAPTVNSESNYSFSNLTSTTNVKGTAGLLHAITINKSAAVLFTVIDSTGVNVTTPLIASFPASPTVGTYIYDVQFVNGLQINMGASGSDITVSYR